GHFAYGFNPPPANFQDPGTIAMLQEAFLFWRIAKGGPGLPKESTPWNSVMPAWEDRLSEEQIWQVIMYLYDATGQHPRRWEETHCCRRVWLVSRSSSRSGPLRARCPLMRRPATRRPARRCTRGSAWSVTARRATARGRPPSCSRRGPATSPRASTRSG